MRFHRGFADVEVGADFLVALATSQEQEDFQLATRQGFAAEASRQFGHERWGNGGFACVHFADGCEQFLPWRVLQQITFCPGFDRSGNVRVGVKGGQHDDAGRIVLAANLLDHGKPFEHGDVVVGDQHPDFVHARMARQLFGGRAHDGGKGAPLACGRTIKTAVPRPGLLSRTSCPPIPSTRSRIPSKPNPSCRAAESKPRPLSLSSSRISFGSRTNCAWNSLARACRSALVKTSWPMRRMFSSHSGGSNRGWPLTLNCARIAVPAVIFRINSSSAWHKFFSSRACGRSARTERRASFKLSRASSPARRRCSAASLANPWELASAAASNCTITPVNPCARVS